MLLNSPIKATTKFIFLILVNFSVLFDEQLLFFMSYEKGKRRKRKVKKKN